MRVSPRPTRARPWAAALAATALVAVAWGCEQGDGGGGKADANASADSGAAPYAFANAAMPPDSGWTGPVFQLSHNYPAQNPGDCPVTTCAWLDAKFDSVFNSNEYADWAPYMDAILAYVVEGQTQDLNDSIGWRVDVNGETRWFHVPWMAYDSVRGREFVHGLTNERTATLNDFEKAADLRAALAGGLERSELPLGLHTFQTSASDTSASDTAFESWSVGFYNPWGAWTIGQAVPANGVPRAAAPSGNTTMPVRFPVGTVVAKVLFSSAGPQNVSFLVGSPRWTADRHVQTGPNTWNNYERAPAPVHLVQMDVAVRDDRSPTGGVYGTYAYDGSLKGVSWWQRMAPVGTQWGSDPRSYSAVDSAESQPIVQSAINTNIRTYQHLGCDNRLAGPVDNPQSSCLSCHQGAYVPNPVGTPAVMGTNIPPIFGFTAPSGANALCVVNDTTSDTINAQNAAYFQNVAWPQPYPDFPGVSGPTINLDTSLQLQVAYTQYAIWDSVTAAARR